MITETAFIGCDNLPQEMAVRLDKGWTFVGEIKTNSLYHNCVCVKCSRRPISYRARVERLEFRAEVVSLRSYLFVNDDMIEVKVYFGVCEMCDSVYWGRSGPPFRRVRSGVLLG